MQWSVAVASLGKIPHFSGRVEIFGGSDWTAENDAAALTKLSQVGVSARVEEEKGGKKGGGGWRRGGGPEYW